MDTEEDPEAVIKLVEKGKSSPEDIIQTPQIEVERIAQINHEESAKLLFHIAQIIYRSKPKTIAEKWKDPIERTKLSLGCPHINSIFNGGLPMQGIIEVVGESATGKTQVVLQALLQAILPTKYGGLGGSGLYLCTEDLPTTRWAQLVDACCEKHTDLDPKEISDHLFLLKVQTIDKLHETIKSSAHPLIRTKDVKLVVIDSIAALFRTEFTISQTQERAAVLYSHAKELKDLSSTFRIPVITVNQVTDQIDDKIISKKASTIPALGLVWSNSLDMRIMLTKTKRIADEEPILDETDDNPVKKKRKINHGLVIREMRIVFAPHLPNNSTYFVIDGAGVRGINS